MDRIVYRIQKPGALKALKLVKEQVPALAPREVRIATKAIGLNFADVFSIYGLYSATPKGSFIPGLEFSGTIIEKGSEVKERNIGERVMGVTRFGAYSTVIQVSEETVFPIPNDWTFEDGASYPVQALTAYFALFVLGDLKENATVLIHSAAGGVGLYANRLAKTKGAFTIGVVGDRSKLFILEKEGFDGSILRGQKFKQNLENQLKNRPLNLVLECLGGSFFQDSYDLLSPTGRIVTYGSAGFVPKGLSTNWFSVALRYWMRPKLDPLAMISENKSVMGFNLIWLWDKMDELREEFRLLQKKNLSPLRIMENFSFENLPMALLRFQSGKTIGKVIVSIQ